MILLKIVFLVLALGLGVILVNRLKRTYPKTTILLLFPIVGFIFLVLWLIADWGIKKYW